MSSKLLVIEHKKKMKSIIAELCLWPERLMKSNNVILYMYETLMSKPWILPVILNVMPFKKDMRVGQGPEKSSWHDQGVDDSKDEDLSVLKD